MSFKKANIFSIHFLWLEFDAAVVLSKQNREINGKLWNSIGAMYVLLCYFLSIFCFCLCYGIINIFMFFDIVVCSCFFAFSHYQPIKIICGKANISWFVLLHADICISVRLMVFRYHHLDVFDFEINNVDKIVVVPNFRSKRLSCWCTPLPTFRTIHVLSNNCLNRCHEFFI